MDKNSANNNSVFKQALTIVKKEWLLNLEERMKHYSGHEFSPEFEKRIEELLNDRENTDSHGKL